jgi:signal transduction histidine kinase
MSLKMSQSKGQQLSRFVLDGRPPFLRNNRPTTTAEDRAKIAEDRLEMALAISGIGSWKMRIGSKVIIGDKKVAALFHVNTRLLARGLPVDDFWMTVNEEDRARMQDSVRKSLKNNTVFDEGCRITLPNGEKRWLLVRGRVEKEQGDPVISGVVMDVTERRDLQAQVELARRQDQLNRQAAKILQERNDELEAIARTKDEFVALASHQLRTPATAVKQYLGMVLQGYAGDISEVQHEMLGKAFEGNERQLQIITQILNAARVDTGRLVMAPVRLDLRTLAQGAANDLRSSFEQHNHTFSIELPEQPVMVSGDQGYLRMAIENILQNATVYTPDGGTIHVTLKARRGQCELRIADTGVGIRKTDIPKLFDKFSRIHNPLSVAAGGSGIGLYLASEIVRLHGGQVKVESKLHVGTTFAIWLPLAQNGT